VIQTFMATEIAEAGAVVRRQLASNSALTAKAAADLRALKPPFVATVARGSSDHAALYLKHLIELKLGLACASLGPSIASLYSAPLKLEGAVAIAISQSGRSPDILAMQRAAKDQRALSVASSTTSTLRSRARPTRCCHYALAPSIRWRRPSR
jgi:glutamine---fructose-6-phosphate transaminase (isomerizing)